MSKSKVVEYTVVCLSSTSDFIEAVVTRLRNGWELYGFPFCGQSGDEELYHSQAMVKYEEVKNV